MRDRMTEQLPVRKCLLPRTLAGIRVLAKVCCGLMLLIGLPLLAQSNYVLVTSPDKVQDVCGRHGLTQLTQGSHTAFFWFRLLPLIPVFPLTAQCKVLSVIALSVCLSSPARQWPTSHNLPRQFWMACPDAPL